jgi:hypothetical protein
MEERYLVVAIHPGGRFYSYLDCSRLHLDIDKRGVLLSIQILVPRNDWTVNKQLQAPIIDEYVNLRFAGFRQSLPEPIIETDPQNNIIHVIFTNDLPENNTYRITDELFVDIHQSEILIGFWITKIHNDRASLNMASWRKEMNTQGPENQ